MTKKGAPGKVSQWANKYGICSGTILELFPNADAKRADMKIDLAKVILFRYFHFPSTLGCFSVRDQKE